MGVTELWSILDPARESVPLYSLTGKTLAVDLSLWVCEAQHVQGMMGKVLKPHLRNLFFRVSSLILMGVKLVFVMEGEAPKLKAETMSKRTEMRFGGFQKKAAKPPAAKSTSRGRFNAVLRECAEMLDCLGVPWVTAAGEAEAMCAFLDLHGFVDGCITNDGDAFLYGAQTVYRNFNMNTKDPQVECYRMEKVQEKLHFSRETLVGFAMLLGCDYIPKGVPGVGKELALKLIHSLNGQSLLEKFREWEAAGVQTQEMTVKKVPHCNVCRHPGSAKAHERSGCVLCDSTHFCQPQDYDLQCPCDWHRSERTRQANATETTVRKKTLACEKFPFTEIIEEFLVNKDKPIQPLRRRKPNILSMQNFASDKMEWPKHYTSEKLLVLMTYTELVNKRHSRDTQTQIEPLRIYKTRVRNGISCFEIIWKKPEHYVFPDDYEAEDQDVVRTVEEEALVRVAYPGLVDLYIKQKEEAEENKNKKKKPKSKKEKPSEVCDDVSDLLARMSLKNTTAEHTANSTTAGTKDKPAAVRTKEVFCSKEKQGVLKDVLCSKEKQDAAKTETEDPVHQQEVMSVLEKPQLSLSALPAPASPAVTSLSTSAVVDNLHLSNIDWEACSFTSSPSQVPSSAKVAQVSSARVDTEALGSDRVQSGLHSGSEVSPAPRGTELLAETEPFSLRERLLMRNTLKSISPCGQATECVSNVTSSILEAQPNPPKRSDSTVVSGHSKPACRGLESEKGKSGLPHMQTQTKKTGQLPLPMPQKAVDGGIPKTSTSTSVPTSSAASKAKPADVEHTNTSPKYKFVKTSKAYAPALLQQTKSSDDAHQKQPKGTDPKPQKSSKPSVCVGIQGPDPKPQKSSKPSVSVGPKGPDSKPRKSSKTSVCVGLVYSSDDSDAENQPRRWQRWNKASKAKSAPVKPVHKPVHPVHKPVNPVQKPTHSVHVSCSAAKTVPATQQNPDPPKKTNPQPRPDPQPKPGPRSGAAAGVSLPERPPASWKADLEVIDLCVSAPGSPLSTAPSEHNDSVVSIESPLPLAQRLKLKLLK